MPRNPSKNTKRLVLINQAYNAGFSGNKTLEILKHEGLGVRRKAFYEEWRKVTEKPEPTKEKRRKSVRKKYKKEAPKKWKKRALKVGQIYRGSLIISSIPLHSSPFNRHYLGFRLNIFSYEKNVVYDALRSMKKQFTKMVAERIRSLPYAEEQVIGVENPTKINTTNSDSLNGKWFFAVEEKGNDIDSESGYI